MNTYRENYPWGRKHCSTCGRWRHVSDFGVRDWLTWLKETPVTLNAECQACARLRGRRGPRTDRVDRKLFIDVVKEVKPVGLTFEELARDAGVHPTVFNRKHDKVSFYTVDKVFTALGIHDQVSVLWPHIDR